MAHIKLPDGLPGILGPMLAFRPTRIVWNVVCAGYVAELAVPWSGTTY
jgi:hypothetical protein